MRMVLAYIVDANYNNSSYFIKKDTVTRIWHHRSKKKYVYGFIHYVKIDIKKRGYRY